VQIVTALAPRAGRLTHFQRTAQWIMPTLNTPFSAEQQAAWRADPALLKALQDDPAYHQRVLTWTAAILDPDSEAMWGTQKVAEQHLEDKVRDPVLREKLRPSYRAGCKRIIHGGGYYEAIQHPNARLVAERIRRVEAEGVRTADGELHPLDVLVLATGFDAHAFMRPMQVIGRGGVTLEQAWAKRATAYLALAIPDFPNLFMMNGPNGPVGNFSLIDVAERQWGYIGQMIELLASGQAREVSPRHAAMAAYDAERIAAAKKTIFASGCRSWYLDSEGVPATWPWSYARFGEEMATPKLEAWDIAA
jgi:cation diffusion facilitator CzcD-associated flavoprotein CzcO